MAKVWAVLEVPYIQTNAWLMAVLAKVVGQVNGYRGGGEKKTHFGWAFVGA